MEATPSVARHASRPGAGGAGDFRLQIADCRFAGSRRPRVTNLQSAICNLKSPPPARGKRRWAVTPTVWFRGGPPAKPPGGGGGGGPPPAAAPPEGGGGGAHTRGRRAGAGGEITPHGAGVGALRGSPPRAQASSRLPVSVTRKGPNHAAKRGGRPCGGPGPVPVVTRRHATPPHTRGGRPV